MLFHFLPKQRLKPVLWELHRMNGTKSQARGDILGHGRAATEFATSQRRYPAHVSPFENVLALARDQISDADFAKDFHRARV